jgi:hypothetical protein
VFFDREGDKYELERCEAGGHGAEVPEALGGGEEIVQGILVFLSERAADTGTRALVLRATAVQAPRPVAHPARSAGSRLSGVGERPLHNRRAASQGDSAIPEGRMREGEERSTCHRRWQVLQLDDQDFAGISAGRIDPGS